MEVVGRLPTDAARTRSHANLRVPVSIDNTFGSIGRVVSLLQDPLVCWGGRRLGVVKEVVKFDGVAKILDSKNVKMQIQGNQLMPISSAFN